MAYAPLTTVANVASYFQGLEFDSGTTVTDTEVLAWIDIATALIYGALGNIYVIPDTGITDTNDLLQLRALADSYAVTMVKFATGAVQTRAVRDGNLIMSEVTLKPFESLLNKYICLEYRLTGTPFQSSTSSFSAYSYTNDNDICAEGKKEVVQW